MRPGGRIPECMRTFILVSLLLTAAALSCAETRHELALTLGRLASNDRGALTAGSGTGLQANYGIRLAANSTAGLYFESHFLASPHREVASTAPQAIRDFASLYVTPGLRVKFVPAARLSPWVAAGGGYGLFEHSRELQDGSPSTVARSQSHFVFHFGGGLDLRLNRFLSARFEVRDFFTASPLYNVPSVSGRQHNVVAGGGLILRWGE